MKNSVVFMIPLAILGIIFGFAVYYFVDLPLRQVALHPLSNADLW
jgi:hypothetical protein